MKIGVVAAMAEEVALLSEKLSSSNEINIGRFSFWKGEIGDIEVGVTRCGIGKVNAAVGTTMLLEKFMPDYLINIGVAGAFGDEVEVGDVVISSEVRHYDADATAFAYELGQIPQMPSAYKADTRLVELAHSACQTLGGVAVHQGQILSGDTFVHTPAQVADITLNFPGAMAVEMEGAAVAQTGYLFKTPFVLIRSISDKVQEADSTCTYKASMQNVAANSVKTVLHMLKNIH